MVAKGVKDATAPAGALSEGQGTAEAPEEQKAEQAGTEDEILGVWEQAIPLWMVECTEVSFDNVKTKNKQGHASYAFPKTH